MNLWDLRIFDMVARTGGIGRAAAELNTVQSNVTARMRRLEEELGTPLFERHSRGVALTAAGRRLQPYAAQVIELMGQAKQATADTGAPSGALAIGAGALTASQRLPRLISRYAQTWPDVDLTVCASTTGKLIEDVGSHRLDGAFVAGPICVPGLISEPMFMDELVLVTHPSVQSLDEVLETPSLRLIVFPSGCAYRPQLAELLYRDAAPPRRTMELYSLDSIMNSVGVGLGVTMLPAGGVSSYVAEGMVATHRIDGKGRPAETCFIRSSSLRMSSAALEFINMARHFRPAVLLPQFDPLEILHP
jgi:DNA-binding transcriptional LysR family regulator